MKKRILTCVLSVGILAALAGCGNQQAGYSSKVLADPDHNSWCLHGPMQLKDAEGNLVDNGWNGKSNDLYELSKMRAVSMKELNEMDSGLAKQLSGKKVKYLYVYEDAVFGMRDAGYTKKYHEGDKFYQTNGSYTFKAAKLNYAAPEEEGEQGVYSEDQWIFDAKTAHAEALTNNLFIPTWQEKQDEYGFSWADDMVIKGGHAGTYTVVVAQYNVQQSATVPGYGIGLILKEEATGGLPAEEVETYSPVGKTLGVIGSFCGWGAEGEVILQGEGFGPYSAQLTLSAEASFKIRDSRDWSGSDWGFGSVDTDASVAGLENDGGNIKAAAGTYEGSISFSKAGIATIVINELQ